MPEIITLLQTLALAIAIAVIGVLVLGLWPLPTLNWVQVAGLLAGR